MPSAGFYFDACGFTSTSAGLIRLSDNHASGSPALSWMRDLGK